MGMKKLIRRYLLEQLNKNSLSQIPDEDTFYNVVLGGENSGWEKQVKMNRVKEVLNIDNKFPNWQFDFVNFDKKAIIEYNGHHHYQTPSKIATDAFKQDALERLGFTYYQHPYWLGIDSGYLNEQGIGKFIDNSYPNIPSGFNAERTELPASYTYAGVERFREEFNNLPGNIQEEVKNSLKNKVQNMFQYYRKKYPQQFDEVIEEGGETYELLNRTIMANVVPISLTNLLEDSFENIVINHLQK
jgi:hypothetical protein